MASLESIASALTSTVAGTTATTSTAKTYRATVNSDGTVTIDGSTTTTPATYTVAASAGDRVTVIIEGHAATVTGNITDPSATTTSVTAAQETADDAAETASAAEEAAKEAAEEAAAAKELAEDQSYLVQADGDTGVKVTRVDSTGTTVGDYAARVVDGGFLVTDADDDSTVYAALTKSGTTFYDAGGNLIAAYTSDGMVLYSEGVVSSTFASDGIVLGANYGNPINIAPVSSYGTDISATGDNGRVYVQMGEQQDGAETGYLVATNDYGDAMAEAYTTDTYAEMAISVFENDSSDNAYINCNIENGSSRASIKADAIKAEGTATFDGTATFTDRVYCESGMQFTDGVIYDSDSGNVFTPQSESGNTNVGYTRYVNANGNMNVYGDEVHLYSNEGVYLNTPNSSNKRLCYVDCGTVAVGGTADAVCSENVTFGVTFESAPIVVATASSPVPGIITEVTVSNRSTTGCTVYQYRTTSATNAVMWIAVGYLA